MSDPFASAAARLRAAAEVIAAARYEQAQLAARDPAAAWRRASLVWPRFTKG
ncbi:hypothetical protein [Novosphingobium sp.]|uniref:hypothetical protein n=1 Tax=Novosphingobium sp. TaxID=1874826 RepID=UPI00286CCF11|nr:hypothetical protein [Novosphingobium sp.]